MATKVKFEVYVYRGLGSSEKCPDTLKNFLRSVLNTRSSHRYKYKVKFISPEDIKRGGLRSDRVIMLAIGGGYDLGYIEALGIVGCDEIVEFVTSGGTYLGICAGAYFASSYCEFDKGGDLEVCGERLLKFYPGKCVGPAYPGFRYYSEIGAQAAKISTRTGHHHMYSYFNGGGYFTLADNQMTVADDQSHDGKSVEDGQSNHVILADNQSNDVILTDNQSNDVILADNQSSGVILAGNQSSGVILAGNQSSGVILAGNQSSGVILAGNQSSGVILAGNQSSGVILADNQSNDVILADNQSNDVILVDNQSNDVILAGNQSSGVILVDNQSNDVILVDNRSTEVTVTDTHSIDTTKVDDNRKSRVVHGSKSNVDRNVEVVARYAEGVCTGEASIVRCSVGLGTAILSGVHFEYCWRDLDNLNLDRDLLVKLNMTDATRMKFAYDIISPCLRSSTGEPLLPN